MQIEEQIAARDLVGTSLSSPGDDEQHVLVHQRQQKELKRCLDRRHTPRPPLPDPPPGRLGTSEASDRPTTIPSPCLAVQARYSAIPWGFCSGRNSSGRWCACFLFWPAYLISHPESIKYVLQQHARNYNKDLITYTMFQPLLGQGLLINDGPSWLHQRRLMQPAFHRTRLSTYGTLMTEATVAMLERWQACSERGMPLNMAEEMMRLTLRIVGQALFTLDLNQEVSTVGDAVTTALELFGDYVFRVGGTSLSSPPIASVFALAGGASSYANAQQIPYTRFTSSNSHDVTTGSNGSCGTIMCNATTGYDGPTGFGTPNSSGGF